MVVITAVSKHGNGTGLGGPVRSMNDREAYGDELTASRLTDSRQTDVGAIGDVR